MPIPELYMPEVPVNGKVLEWARRLRGLSVDDAALLLGIQPNELLEYESGNKRPLVGFLRTMSAKYEINFTSLLMPQPLPIEKGLTDHRVRSGRSPLNIDTLIAMEEVNEALDTFADIADDSRRLVPKLTIGTATLRDDPETIAARERKRFGVSLEEQRTWRGLDSARRQWRQRIEDRGVFTYMIKLQAPEELSGFSILKNDLAAICVNDREPTEGAKIFTLFHEYCHLLLRQNSISDENNSDRVERFCNRFAASFLIPKQALRDSIDPDLQTPHEFSDADVKNLARQFRVSNRAMAYRLEETALAPEGFYQRRTGPWDLPIAQPSTTGSESKPTYITLQLKRIGRLHAATALRAAKHHIINSFDASQLIGLKPTSFPKLEAVLK